MNHIQFPTQIGAIGLTWNSMGCISRVDWYDTLSAQNYFPKDDSSFPRAIRDFLRQLEGYISHGEPIASVPWDLIDQRNWSDFQKRVYEAVARIPHGETRTYSWVAARVGMVSATRAVGQALRRNPIPILIPCHRVVSTSTMGGFMGTDDPDQPELKLKNRLIQLEESYRSPCFDFCLSAPGPTSTSTSTLSKPVSLRLAHTA